MNGATQLPLSVGEQAFGASGDSLVRRSVLPSGVRVLSERVPGARSATIGFWVAVGSRDELPETYGSTHFLEHLLFKGTAERSALDIAVSFDAVGGEHNAVTAKEYTCYYAKVQDKDVPMAVDVLADMFTSSLIDPEEFETERGVILEELAMADDDPSDVASERFFEAVMGEHPLGRPIGGSPQTIGAVSRDAVWGHYRANYGPSDLVVTVAGAVDHDELLSRVERCLSGAGWDLAAQAVPGPLFTFSAYLGAYVFLGLSNALVVTAIQFSLVVLSRRAMTAAIGGLLLAVACIFSWQFLARQLGWWELAKMLEEKGFGIMGDEPALIGVNRYLRTVGDR